MSMTATISLSNATPGINQATTASVTISNSGASAVTITSLTPLCTPRGNALLSTPTINPNNLPSVPASGSLVITYQAIFSDIGTFALGAAIDSSDGSIFSPSTTNATVTTYVTATQPSAPINQLISVLTGEVTTAPVNTVGSAVATLTNSAVIGKVLTGYVSGAGTVAATDTILTAVNKLNGNQVLSKATADAALPTASFTSAAVTAKLITGFVSGAGTVAATDTILQAANKLDGNQIASAAVATSVQGGLFGSTGANAETSTADGSAISVTKFLTNISAAGAQTRTLAAPAAIGQMKLIYMTVHGGDCTLALTNVDAGTTATFDAVGDSLVLMAVSTSKWTKIGGSAAIT